MSAVASHITGVSIFFNRLFRCKSKKTSKLRVTGFYEGNSPVTVEFPHRGPFDDVIMSIVVVIAVIAEVIAVMTNFGSLAPFQYQETVLPV